jgi:hypothetical protein
MAKHGKKKDETRGNPVIRILNAAQIRADKAAEAARLKKDIEIIDNGWKNTKEGQEDLRTKGGSRKSAGTGKRGK